MKEIIKKLPIPITALMLGLVATGNLVLSYGEIYRNIFGVLSAVILVLIIIKILMFPKNVLESLDNVVVASAFPTLSMGIMLLSTYLKPFNQNISFGIWSIGLILHVALIIFFTRKHISGFNIKKVFPSYFVVYVGIVVGSITAPVFNMIKVGQVLFYFGFISFIILLPIVLKRLLIIKDIPEMSLPTTIILTAPAALCLAGYMNSFPNKNMFIVYLLLVISQVLYLMVLTQLPKMLKLKFYPSYSAFTFPMVITAISLKLTNGFLIKAEKSISILKYLVKFEEFLAISLVVYVLIRYMMFLFGTPDIQKGNKLAKEN